MGEWDSAPTVQKTATAIKPSTDWLERKKETMLLFGPPGVGKTQAYLTIVKKIIKEKPDAKIYLINTDDGVRKTAIEFFGAEIEEFKKRVEYYSIIQPDQFEGMSKYLKQNAKEGDWIIFDLLNFSYDTAQEHFVQQAADAMNIPISEYVQAATNDSKKFGLLASQQWQIIKRVDSLLTTDILVTTKCNIIGVCTDKSTAMESAMVKSAQDKGKSVEKSDILTMFEELGHRPSGRKDLPFLFDSVIYLGGMVDKYYVVVKDRGHPVTGNKIKFGENFWEAFQKTIGSNLVYGHG